MVIERRSMVEDNISITHLMRQTMAEITHATIGPQAYRDNYENQFRMLQVV